MVSPFFTNQSFRRVQEFAKSIFGTEVRPDDSQKYQTISRVGESAPQVEIGLAVPLVNLTDHLRSGTDQRVQVSTNTVSALLSESDGSEYLTYKEDFQSIRVHSLSDGSALEEGVTHNEQRVSTYYNWRPVPLRNTYLAVTLGLSLILAIGQEVLYQVSRRRKGLFTYHYVEDIDHVRWFCWRFLPTLIVILYGIVVATLDHQLMRLAPFYNLARKSGLRGDDALLRNPINYFWYVCNPRKAGPKIWLSTFAVICAQVLVPPIQTLSISNETTTVRTGQAPNTYPTTVVSVHPVWSRVLTAILLLVTITILSLQILLRQPSGLSEDPGGIAGTLSAIVNGDVMETLQTFSIDSSKQEIAASLRLQRFGLREGSIRRLTPTVRPNEQNSTSHSKSTSPQKCIVPQYQIFVLVILGMILPFFILFTVVVEVIDIRAVPWLATTIAVIYKILWSQFEIFSRGIEPYLQLWWGCAPPSILFVDYTGLPILIMPIEAMRRGHYILAWIGVNSILAEILVVFVASLAANHYEPGMVYKVSADQSPYTVSSLLAVVIPMIMSITITWISLARRHASLPRKPGNIASILVYVKGTNLLESFKAMQTLTPKERLKTLSAQGKSYALGYFTGPFRTTVLSIDEEPRTAFHLSA